MNCKVFRSAPLAFALMAHPADTDVLRDVETYLNTRGVSFASLVIDALRDPESSLTGDLIARITDILDAIRPKLNISLVLNACGVSFASLVIDTLQDPESSLAGDLTARITDVLDALRPNFDTSSATELGRFFASIASSELTSLGEDDSWHLPATKLSARQLQEFSMKKMSQRAAAEAPGFSTFLHSVCVGNRTLSEVIAEDDETSVRPEARRSVDPVQLLDIVRTFTSLHLLDSRR